MAESWTYSTTGTSGVFELRFAGIRAGEVVFDVAIPLQSLRMQNIVRALNDPQIEPPGPAWEAKRAEILAGLDTRRQLVADLDENRQKAEALRRLRRHGGG